MDNSLASAAHQIAEQVWPLFKRLPKTIYHILVVNDHYDDQFNFFFEIYRPHFRTHSYPLYSMSNQQLDQLETLLRLLREQEGLQINIDFRGFNNQRWPSSQRRIASRPYQTPPFNQDPITKDSAVSPSMSAPVRLPKYRDDEAAKVASAFFKNEYIDYGMGKWHGFRIAELNEVENEFSALPIELPKNQQSLLAIRSLLKLGIDQNQPVHLQLYFGGRCHGISGVILGTTRQTVFIKPKHQHQLALPLKLIRHGELLTNNHPNHDQPL
ncbi:hypothetical protein [Limosilactobacillus mucosae]|uniref:hypothetical protein n=1 Tax=Limosilactobacillus mucosae TaxID=97478 RepID=UPI000886320E|nr:hypothetical protein [Limosilactobacillus mucosae]SDN39263.1 hypothetical protein SAMN05216430_1068 [Limosilactobacillus mucosae]SEK93205.1 hypothetical protein SAMN05216545_106117 [Limosilactobacillus mucosae]SFK15434.1 hypothetical protein SAMN05216461_1068 [Limosilactobacillus mucosae]